MTKHILLVLITGVFFLPAPLPKNCFHGAQSERPVIFNIVFWRRNRTAL